MSGYLVVRVGDGHYGLRVDHLLEVADGFETHAAPSVHPAVRGVTPFRERLVPLVSLAGLLDVETPDHARATVVFAQCSGSVLAFEVDDAEEVVLRDAQPVPDAWQFPWAVGVAHYGGTLIPVVDLGALSERLVPVPIGEDV